jgi:large subunit ribosomal protein L1
MGDIASSFGKVLGPKGKMPNPKAGCIVPPVIPTLEPIKQKINSTINLVTKDQLVMKSSVGYEDMSDEDLTENINFIYNNLLHALPKEKENIRSIFIKFTMSPSVEITDNGPIIHDHKKTTEKKE